VIVLLLALLCAAIAVRLAYRELAAGRAGARGGLARAATYGRADTVAAPVQARDLRIVDTLARVTLRIAPGRERGKTAAQLHRAGLERVRPETFLAVKAGVAAGLGTLGFTAGAAAGSAVRGIALLLIAAAIGFVVPDFVLQSRARKRQEAVLAELPNALDLLAVIVEAGLGLDAALARYAQTAETPLGAEIRIVVAELRVGKSRVEVLKRLADRVPAPETKAFVRAIVQADQLGSSLSGTLRSLAEEVRHRRQSTAEEIANKAPVKMLFPTVLCIFPVLFVVVLGPVLLQLVGSL
jgi:tight adherence protein C